MDNQIRHESMRIAGRKVDAEKTIEFIQEKTIFENGLTKQGLPEASVGVRVTSFDIDIEPIIWMFTFGAVSGTTELYCVKFIHRFIRGYWNDNAG